MGGFQIDISNPCVFLSVTYSNNYYMNYLSNFAISQFTTSCRSHTDLPDEDDILPHNVISEDLDDDASSDNTKSSTPKPASKPNTTSQQDQVSKVSIFIILVCNVYVYYHLKIFKMHVT